MDWMHDLLNCSLVWVDGRFPLDCDLVFFVVIGYICFRERYFLLVVVNC